MNYLSIVKKHMELAEVAYGNIVTDATRDKARVVVGESVGRMGMGDNKAVGVPAETVILVIPEPLAGANQGGEALPVSLREDAPKALETPVIEVAGDFTPVKTDIPVVELIGGWPKIADIEVIGLAPNRRCLKGRLGDGRTVSMERTHRAFKVLDKVVGKLIRAGGSPLYRVA